LTIRFLSAYNDCIGSRDVATRISESPLDWPAGFYLCFI